MIFAILIAVAIGAIIMLMIGKKEEKIEFTDKQAFIQNALFVVTEAGFKNDVNSENFMSFSPTIKAGLASGPVTIRIYENYAIINAKGSKIGGIMDQLKK